jgi:c-di-AMP phosphodiesterase-like protein
MPTFLRRLRKTYKTAFYGLTLFVIGILALQSWLLGLFAFVVYCLLLVLDIKAEQRFEQLFDDYISTLSHRIKRVGDQIVTELPIGIMLYDEKQMIQWHNRFMLQLVQAPESLVGKKVDQILPKLSQWLNEGEQDGVLRHEDTHLLIMCHPEERLIYFFDHTDYQQLQQKYRMGQMVLVHIHLDNLDEVTQGLDEQRRTLLVSEVTRSVNQWANKSSIFLRRTSSDKFFGVTNEKALRSMEEGKFDILDTVRDITSDNKLPVTLSIGVGAGTEDVIELGKLAQSSLDIALGRGGDQAAVKRGSGKIAFYGGKTNAMEKRTRVRVRVISHALRDLIKESDAIFIMGHRDPDMDSLGAAIGVLKAVQVHDKQGLIVLDETQHIQGVSKLLDELKKDDVLRESLISPQEAWEKKTERSLLIIVDVHKPSLVMEPRLVEAIPRKVVIDHHRRGEEFITEPLLVYIEPYASSTSELVAELLAYQGPDMKLKTIEATSLLAGIMVDTKNFIFRTGSRTFEAASYLRHHGADSSLVQKMLKEDLNHFVRRAQIVASAQLYRDQIAIAISQRDENHVILAQAADTLLGMNNVAASCVIGQREGGGVTISARSMGDINVQVIMEKLGGGGHLTNAATQLGEQTVEEAVTRLKQVIDEYFEGGTKG